MKIRYLIAIIFIFLATSAAWAILGATVFARTYERSDSLRSRVQSIWGAPQNQKPPAASYTQPEAVAANTKEGKPETVMATYQLPLNSTRAQAQLELEPRQKGLLWYSTYRVRFDGRYEFVNDTPQARTVTVAFPLPGDNAIYDDLIVKLNGTTVPLRIDRSVVKAETPLPAGGKLVVEAAYRSQGLDSWAYTFGDAVTPVKDFQLTATTDFAEPDFPDNSLSPTAKQRAGGGWQLTWAYKHLVSGHNVHIEMPQITQPGPLAGRISFFAPVSLFFFFFILLMITVLRRIELHPMHYFFLAAAFFAFHLLLAYLADHISIHLAFAVSAAVSLFLVISYLYRVVGIRFAAVEAGIAQLIYLVLFSYAFFFEGYTGLAVTIGAILTLFAAMQLTAKVRWAELGAAKSQEG